MTRKKETEDIFKEAEPVLDAETVSTTREKSSIRRFLFFISSVRRLKLRTIIIAIFLIIGWLGMIYFYNQYSEIASDPQVVAQKQATKVLVDLSSIIELPENELPSISTVTDISALTGNPFFARAQNSDVLIVYTQGQQAIIFRPSIKKVINVGAYVPQAPAPKKVMIEPSVENVIIPKNDTKATQ